MRLTSASSRWGIFPIVGVFGPIEARSGLPSSLAHVALLQEDRGASRLTVRPRGKEDRDRVDPVDVLERVESELERLSA